MPWGLTAASPARYDPLLPVAFVHVTESALLMLANRPLSALPCFGQLPSNPTHIGVTVLTISLYGASPTPSLHYMTYVSFLRSSQF